MSGRIVLANIAAFGLQVTVLVAAAAALARAFRIEAPRAMLAYWRTLLLVCLMLPLCQPWNSVVPPAQETRTIVMPASAVPPAGGLAPRTSGSVRWPIGDLALIVLVAGIAARALWLTVGACGLCRLRRAASPLDPLPDAVRDAQARIGAKAAVLVSDRISGPITFGVFRPVIVLPPAVAAMPAHVQEAITYHELLHVRRRDWLAEILEEMIRTALWFHPAVWWLIGRIQLTREQVVDQEAIQLTNSRDQYVEALLAVALSNSPLAFTPVSAFLRRHALKTRVARILQETTMTTRRLIASLTASAAALALAATFAVRSFPLEAQARAQANNGNPVQIVQGGEDLVHGERPEYPPRAAERGIEGDVVVDMTLNERGEVSDARIVSGPEELRRATLEAVLQWHYSPSAMSSTVAQATVRFHVPADPVKAALFRKTLVTERLKEKIRWPVTMADHEKRRVMEIEKALEDPATTGEQRAELQAKYVDMKKIIEKIGAERKEPGEVDVIMNPGRFELKHYELKHQLSANEVLKYVESEKPLQQTFGGTWRLGAVRTEGVPEATAKELLARAGVAVGDAITGETEKRIQEVAAAMDEHFRLVFMGNEDTGRLSITIRAR